MAAALRTGVLLLTLLSCATRTAAPLPEDSPEAGEVLLHAGPLKPGQIVRAAIVSQSFPVAMAAAEVRGEAGTADAVAYDAFSGGGERILVVSGDLGDGPVIIDKTPLLLSSNHVLAEVWVRVQPNGFVDVSWQLLYGEPKVKVTANGSGVSLANGTERSITSVRRAAVFPNSSVRVCPSELSLEPAATATLPAHSYCVFGDAEQRLPLVLSRSDGAQAIAVGSVQLAPQSEPQLGAVRVAELETRLGADGALSLRAPDGTTACACEGTVFGREQVTLVRAERDCVLVRYPDKSQRCLEAAAAE